MLISLSVIPEQINPLSVVCCWAQWTSQTVTLPGSKDGRSIFHPK